MIPENVFDSKDNEMEKKYAFQTSDFPAKMTLLPTDHFFLSWKNLLISAN